MEGAADRAGASLRQLPRHQSGLGGQKCLAGFRIRPIQTRQLPQGGLRLPLLFLPLLHRPFPFRKLSCQAKQPLFLACQPLQTQGQRISSSGRAFQLFLLLFQRLQLSLQSLQLLLRFLFAPSGLRLAPCGLFLFCQRLSALFKQGKVALQLHKLLLQAGETGVMPLPFLLRFQNGGMDLFLQKRKPLFSLLLLRKSRVPLLFSLLKILPGRSRLFRLLRKGEPLFQRLLLFLSGKQKGKPCPLLFQKVELPVGFLRLPQLFLQRAFCLLLFLFLPRHIRKRLFLSG